MIPKQKTCILFISAFLGAILMNAMALAQGDDQKRENTPTYIDMKNVNRIDVILIDEEATFRVAVTQDFIEKNYDVKYSVRNEYANELFDLLKEQIAKVKEVISARNHDFRYAVIFFDEKDKRLFSLYIDHLGSGGLLNGKSVEFGSGLKKLLLDLGPSIKNEPPSQPKQG